MTYAAILFLFGLALAWRGIAEGGWALALLWPAASLLLAGLSYAGLGPQVFGKQASGRLTLWARLIHWPLRLYLLVVWHLWRVTGREDPCTQLAEDIFIGRLPRNTRLPDGLINCVDLTAEFEATTAATSLPNYICLPILDGTVPDAGELDAAIARLKPGPTLVHCAQGHGRTALFAVALLASRGLVVTLEQGMGLLAKVRPRARLNSNQRKFLDRYLADKRKSAAFS